jgi:hypothetical protein
MTRFRDKFVAHRELELFLEPVPDFNIALAVAYHYDNWLRHSIAPGIWEEPPLEQFAEFLKKSTTPLIDRLFCAKNGSFDAKPPPPAPTA